MILVAAIALVVWVISWFRAPDAVATSAARPWPGGMGTLDAAAERFPPQQANAASLQLTALANALPTERDATAHALRAREGRAGRDRVALQRRRVDVRPHDAALQPRDRDHAADRPMPLVLRVKQ